MWQDHLSATTVSTKSSQEPVQSNDRFGHMAPFAVPLSTINEEMSQFGAGTDLMTVRTTNTIDLSMLKDSFKDKI